MGSAAGLSTLGFDNKTTQSAMRGANPQNFSIIISGRQVRQPDRLIYIHTVARRSFGPLTRTLFPWLKLAGCEHGEEWTTCCAIPDPIGQASPDQERGGTRIDEHDGWRAAVDLLNPSNLTNNPFSGSGNPDFFANRNGQNLIAEGFWPSLNETPTADEIKLAKENVGKRYRWLTREATRLAAVSTKDLNEFLQTYPDTHIAMDALGMEANWHQLNVVKVLCHNCGDQIKPGIAAHQSSAGFLCVIDPLRAWKMGAITKEKYEDLATAPEPAKKK